MAIESFGLCDIRLDLTTEMIWFCNKEGDGTLKTNRFSKGYLETIGEVNLFLGNLIEYQVTIRDIS